MQEVTKTERGKPPDSMMQTKDTAAGKDAQVRRTRGHAPLRASAANGQRSNGHAALAAEHDRERAGANGQSKRSSPNGKAASDDASGPTAAMAQNSAAASLPQQVSTDRFACAEVAEPLRATAPQTSAAVDAGSCVPGEGKDAPIPPGSEALPEDGMTFVDAMHERIDLWKVGKKLMQNEDPKIVQRAWERLLEMKYGKGPSMPGDEVPQIIIDTPRPIRD
jgi:hypothetical protein